MPCLLCSPYCSTAARGEPARAPGREMSGKEAVVADRIRECAEIPGLVKGSGEEETRQAEPRQQGKDRIQIGEKKIHRGTVRRLPEIPISMISRRWVPLRASRTASTGKAELRTKRSGSLSWVTATVSPPVAGMIR